MRPIFNFLPLITALCVGCPLLVSVAHAQTDCEKKATKFDTRLYQLYIGKSGDLVDPASGTEVKDIDIVDSCDQEVSKDKEDAYISRIFKNFDEKKDKNPHLQLTIYVHGGLNKMKEAISHANERVVKAMLDDNKYPLFISWNSGAFSNYSDHLFLLRRGTLSWSHGPSSSPFVLVEDLARAVARLPASTYQVLFTLNSKRQDDSVHGEEASEAEKRLAELIGDGQFKMRGTEHPDNSGLNFRDRWTLFNPLKLVTAPFLDGLGTGAWNSMLRRTDMVLHKEAPANSPEEQKETETAASRFLTRWQDKDLNKHARSEVILIGHSMGAIITNNILTKYQNINFSQIVYMAAACTVKDLEYVIAPYLERNEEAVFYNLTLNPERDIYENTFYDFLPRGSLLMWIDQTLANVNSFQDRTAGYWFNIVRSAKRTFGEGVRERVHLTKFGINDDGSPQNHGEFDNYPFWKKSFWEGNLKGE